MREIQLIRYRQRVSTNSMPQKKIQGLQGSRYLGPPTKERRQVLLQIDFKNGKI
jgi:hypothetical protein